MGIRGVFCLTLVVLAHGAPLQPRAGAERLQSQAPLCGSCRWLVKSLKCELSDVDTQSEIIGMVLKDVCSKLPADAQDVCGQLAPQLIPLGIMYIQSLSANELCADATLCGPVPSKTSRLGLAQQNDFNCPICKMLLITMKQELKNPESEKEMIERAHEVVTSLCWLLVMTSSNLLPRYLCSSGVVAVFTYDSAMPKYATVVMCFET